MIDYVRQDKESKRGLETGIKGLFPIKGKNHDLDIKDIEITSKFGPSDLSQQKEDKLKGNTFSGDMKGTFVLKDKDGKVLDQKRMKVMNVPTVTERGSYIIKGTEYNVPYQFRRKPGVYSRVQDDGNLTAEVNLAKGANFKVMLDDDEKFYMLYRGNKIPLYPVLTAMGKTRGEIERVWGKELVDINSAGDQEKPVKKLYKKMGGDPTDNFEEMKTGIQSYFNDTSMDPDVTKQTLGKEFDRVSSDLLSQTSKKLLDIKKGRDKPDERDSLRFKSVVGHEDFIKERVEKQAYGITRKIKNRLDNKDKVSDIVSATVFDKPINSFYHDGEVALSGTPRQANPIDMLSEAQKITLTGAGGLTNPEAVTDEARSVHPSSMGFVDPIFTPESSQIGLTLHTAMGAQKEGTALTTKVINRKTGKEERIDPATLEDSTVSFADEYEIKNGKYRPKSRKVRAYSSKGKMETVDPKDVDYIMKDGKMMFSLASNLVPFLQSTHPNRGMMASKMMSQSLPLTHKETPLVQTTINGQKIHQTLGEAFVSKAKAPGTVKSITKDHIVVQHKDGEEKYPYYRDFPLNENHFSNDKILVKKGDKVSKGQRLTENMFTDKGSLAYGTNLRTSYMAPKGLTFEDAVVISESASEKLKSEHMYTKDVELDKTTVTSLPKFRLYAPTALSSKNAQKLDQDGVIRKGETVEPGDIVIAGLKKMVKTPDEEIIGKFNKKIKPYRKYTKEWDHDTPGIVTDVVKSPRGIQVYIKTQERAQVGDKLCYDDETEILTDSGWKHFSDLTLDDKVAINDNNNIVYENPESLHMYHQDGDMYRLESQLVDLFVTKKHSLYVKKRGSDRYELIKASDVIGKRVKHKRDACNTNKDIKKYYLDSVSWTRRGKGTVVKKGRYVDMDSWLVLLGLYISEGSLIECKRMDRKGSTERRVDIAVHKKRVKNALINCCKKMNMKVGFYKDCAHINDFRVVEALKRCGRGALNKKIPGYAFDVSERQARILVHYMMLGDRAFTKSGSWSYFTSSRILRDDFQRICLHAGWSANYSKRYSEGERFKIRGVEYKYNADAYKIGVVKTKNEPTINHGHSKRQNGQSECFKKYKGKVWCCTVRTGVVYVRRNGKPVWCGNSGHFGNKGVISEILPEHEMPKDKEGRHTEIIMNPLGIPSRINPSQLLSTAAGKIAEKTGKPYEIENMSNIDYLSKIKKDLKDNGLSDKEELFDPTTNRSLGNIMTGKQYIMKLDHNVEKKLSARGPMGEAEYTEDLTPTAGKGRGGQSADALTVYSLMSHGAKENLKEMATTKAEKNDEFWMALESGMPLPNPKPTFAWKKFLSKLKASGINVQENGNKIQLMPLTDKQVTEMSNGEVQKEDLIRSKNLVPMKGGLFDKDITGGARGEKWSHVKLSEPMVNPVFIKPVSKLLGITATDIDKITSGDLYLDRSGNKVSKDSPDAETGTKAIKRALKSINVNSKLSELEQKAKNSKGNDLDNINRQIRYLRNLKKLNYKPDVFMSSKVPILPPVFRPVYPMPDGNLRTSHINVPYKDLITINNQLKDAKKIGIPEDQMKEAKAQLFDAYKALVGVANPVTRKEFKGTLESVVGARPKTGYYQSKLISRRQELTGRSTIIPNPGLAMDEVEIPEDILWNIYKPFVKKNMKNQGYSILQSGEEIDRRSDVARRSLDKELAKRPVMLNRAPSLHKFSVMAFHPKRSSKKAISLNPFVVSGFNADFDGDTVSVHVPIREKARKEAYKMLPSANLFSPRDNSLVHKPSMEVITGLNMLTRVKKKTNKKYTSDKQAMDAYKDKYIGMNDEITVGNEKTTVGRILLNRNLPKNMKINAEMTKKTMNNYLRDVATKKPQLYAKVNETLRDFGNDAVFKGGFTIGLDDVSFDQKKRDALFDSVEKSLGKNPSDEKIVNAYARVSEKLNDKIDKLPDTNAFKLMMDSGSKGNAGQIRQVMMAPTQVQDLNENPVLMPIRHSYAEGLSTGEYMATQAGARRTMMDRALQTKWPGALNKEVVNSTSTQVVNSNDCGTREGIMMDVDDDNILNRYVASDPSGTLKYNSLIDTTSRSLLKKKKVKSIKVRTPLKCKLVHGICSKCFGKDETGNDPDIGSNIGIKAAQTISEPATQMSVSGNTKVVFVKDGEVCVDKIGSIIDREISKSGKMDKHGWEVAESGIKSFSLEKDGKVSLRDVSVLSRHKAPEMMVKIKTMGGREIVATPYHSFVIRDENKIMKAPATSLRIGKRIPVLKETPLPGKKKVVDLDSTEVVWSPISSIEYVYPDTDYVYDFTVPGPQNFATFDGIITANTMKTFHTGGASGQTQNISQGFWRIQDLLHLRSSLPNKAILSQESGRVDSVKASPTGGFDVFVNDVKHHVPSGRKVIVSEKAKIQRGDALSDGPAKPQDIAELKDMEGASKYLVDELDKTYKANGIKIDRRMLETVARPMTTTARVLDPGDSDFAPGDFANINDVESRNKKLKNKIQVEPKMIGINSVPLYTEDWLNRLNSTRLKDTLVDGASMGFVSEISPRLSPIGSYAYGVEKTASEVEGELDFNWFEDVYPSIEWFGEENATS